REEFVGTFAFGVEGGVRGVDPLRHDAAQIAGGAEDAVWCVGRAPGPGGTGRGSQLDVQGRARRSHAVRAVGEVASHVAEMGYVPEAVGVYGLNTGRIEDVEAVRPVLHQPRRYK